MSMSPEWLKGRTVTVWAVYRLRERVRDRLLAEAPRLIRSLVGYEPHGYTAAVPTDPRLRELGMVVDAVDGSRVASSLREMDDITDVWIDGMPCG